jgi:endo-1,4-beta-mannosidase
MADTPFSLGITYWPQRSAYRGWIDFDRSAVREELAQIASFGCDTLRLCLRWEDFQPRPSRIASGPMRALEQALDSAQSSGLRVVAALFAGAMGGALQLPAWTTGAALLQDDVRLATRFGPLLLPSEPQPPVVYEDMYHETAVRALYRDSAQIEAQRYLIREVVGYFGQHPAIWAWQLGYELERARLPRSAEEAHDWLALLSDIAREQGAARLLGAASTRSLARREALRPEHLAELSDVVALHAWPYEPLRVAQPQRPTALLVLHALSVALAGRPVLVANLGLATAPDNHAQWVGDRAFGRAVRTYLASEDEQAGFVEQALAALYRAGAAGAWLAAYADAPADLLASPPFDRSRHARTLGLVRGDGREKPAAEVLRRFAEQLRGGALGAHGSSPPALEIDPDDYWRDPAGEMQRLLRSWEEREAEEQ